MKTRQLGMVLLTTIGMMVILTMLVLSLMQAVFLTVKLTHQFATTHATVSHLEAVVARLSVAIDQPSSTDCTNKDMDPNQSIALLLHNKGCSLNDHNRQYDYLITDLGPYPCLQIYFSKKTYSSHHWLISVASAPPHQAILQVRIAKPISAKQCELTKARTIISGIMSWRYLQANTILQGV